MASWDALDWFEFEDWLNISFDIDVEHHTDLQKLAVAVFRPGKDDALESVLVSAVLADLLGYSCDGLLGREPNSFMVPSEPLVQSVLNSSAWDPICRLHDLASKGRDSKEFAEAAPVTSFIVTPTSTGQAFWNVITAFPGKFLDGSHCVIHVSTPLKVGVPEKAIWPDPDHGWSVAQIQVLEAKLGPLRNEFEYLSSGFSWEPIGELSNIITPRLSQLCDEMVRFFEDSLEGGHFVARVGGAAVQGFEEQHIWVSILQEVRELRTLWHVCDQQAADGMTIACAVSDFDSLDCPLVYVSPGFEELTGYDSAYAAGRNCRFLQPKEPERNKAFNGPELLRMKHFCTKVSEGRMVNLLLNEKRGTGEPFWNLLYMQHVVIHLHGVRKHYIFGLQTNLEVQKELMNAMMPWQWTTNGLAILARLRAIIRNTEKHFCPTQSSFSDMANNVTAQWVMEIGTNVPEWAMQAVCPEIAHRSVVSFTGKFPELANTAMRSVVELQKVRRRFLDDRVFQRRFNPDLPSLACSILEASTRDCSLSYIDSSFKDMCGHDLGDLLGRNYWDDGCCLNLSSVQVNELVNGEALTRMRKFCLGKHKIGHSISVILLNRMGDGKSFWHLLRLMHECVDMRSVILVVHTVVELPVPEQLDPCERIKLDGTQKANLLILGKTICGSTVNEEHLGEQSSTNSMSQLQELLKLYSGEYVGDNFVPKKHRELVGAFQHCDAGTNSFVTRVQPKLGLFQFTLGCNEELLFTIHDAVVNECPLVHVSDAFVKRIGRDRAFCLGRNLQFLQPRLACRREVLNQAEQIRIETFMSAQSNLTEAPVYQPRYKRRSLGRCSLGVSESWFPLRDDTWIMSLQVHEDSAGVPFWNMVFMEKVCIHGRLHVVSVHTPLDKPSCYLDELLCTDEESMKELARLREIIASHSECLNTGGRLTDIIFRSFREWDLMFPEFMRQKNLSAFPQHDPCLACVSPPLIGYALPRACLELTVTSLLTETVPMALQNGCRHIQFVFPTDVKEKKGFGELFASRITSMFKWLHLNYFDYYLASEMTFGLRTPPQFIDEQDRIRMVLAENGFQLSYWLLDASQVVEKSAAEIWLKMSQEKNKGHMRGLGVFCASVKLIMAVRRCCASKIDVVVAPLYRQAQRGSVLDGSDLEAVADSLETPAAMFAYSIFGKRCTADKISEEGADRDRRDEGARLSLESVSLFSGDSMEQSAALLNIADMLGFGSIYCSTEYAKALTFCPAMFPEESLDSRLMSGSSVLPNFHRTLPRKGMEIAEKQVKRFVNSVQYRPHTVHAVELRSTGQPILEAWLQGVRQNVAEFESLFLSKRSKSLHRTSAHTSDAPEQDSKNRGSSAGKDIVMPGLAWRKSIERPQKVFIRQSPNEIEKPLRDKFNRQVSDLSDLSTESSKSCSKHHNMERGRAAGKTRLSKQGTIGKGILVPRPPPAQPEHGKRPIRKTLAPSQNAPKGKPPEPAGKRVPLSRVRLHTPRERSESPRMAPVANMKKLVEPICHARSFTLATQEKVLGGVLRSRPAVPLAPITRASGFNTSGDYRLHLSSLSQQGEGSGHAYQKEVQQMSSALKEHISNLRQQLPSPPDEVEPTSPDYVSWKVTGA